MWIFEEKVGDGGKWVPDFLCDFKAALETKKPKSWLKSVSAFANGIGGTLFFGIDDDRKIVGLSDPQKDAESISRLIKERITPIPSFVLKPDKVEGKSILALMAEAGRSTPYYYRADGVMECYMRIGNVFRVWRERGWEEPVIAESAEPDRTVLCLSLQKRDDKNRQAEE